MQHLLNICGQKNVQPRKPFQQLGIFIVATCHNTCIRDPISKTLLKLHEEQDLNFWNFNEGFYTWNEMMSKCEN